MKKSLVIIASMLMLSLQGFAQGKLEYSGFFDSYYYKGIRNLNFTANLSLPFYRGDLCETCLKPTIGFGLGVNYKLWPRTMFGAEFHYLSFSGKDSQTNRNLSFSGSGFEYLAYGRFYFVDDIIRVAADRGREPRLLKMYLVAGVGLLSYKATSEFTQPSPPTDSTFYYQENVAYPRKGLVIPLGIGFSWRISNKVSLITEAGYRLTFTDHLDNVSLRGNPDKNDGYAVVDIKVQISPFAKGKKKAKTLAPPQKYDGPKGTDTWKNRKKEEPVRKNNYYDEEVPTEENQDEQLEEENQEEVPQEENQEENPDDGWGN